MATETADTKVAVATAANAADTIAKIKALEALIVKLTNDYLEIKKQFTHHVDMYNKHVVALHK